jgi:thiamine-phosphate pyrophosphorylase
MAASTPRERLAAARLYLCTDSRRRQGDLVPFLDAVLGGGVDAIQLREKGLEAGEELELLAAFDEAAQRHGALHVVNDRADVALAAAADGVHLGQGDLPVPVARRILGADAVIGRSTHAAEESAAAAADPAVDYFCVGPCWPTPTKPGRPAPGLGLVRFVAGLGSAKPWFAIGGIDEDRLGPVLEAGARRVVVVRVLTEADDPHAVAKRLSARLDDAG